MSKAGTPPRGARAAPASGAGGAWSPCSERRRHGLACALFALGLHGRPAHAVLRLGPGFALAQALAEARDGDVIEIPSGHYAAQVAVITQRQLTLRGVGPTRPVLQAAGHSAEDKAILVVRDGDIRIENLEFHGCRVADGNGAGIRFERGRLVVERCAFVDNEMGLLTASTPDAELRLVACEFGPAPRHPGLLHHLLYVGAIARLSIVGSRFHGGWRGHLIKSRARESRLHYNLVADGARGGASYELDLPNGGLAWLVGNIFAQGALAQHDTVVAFGAEGGAHADSALFMAHNTLINEAPRPAQFVRFWSDRLPAGAALRMVNNLMVGTGTSPAARADGNLRLPLAALRQPLQPRYELADPASLAGLAVAAGRARREPLAPRAEFSFPAGTQPLAAAASRPGALQ